MRHVLWALPFAFFFACSPSVDPASAAAAAAIASRRATASAIERVFRAPQADANWFAPSLLAETPIERIRDVIDVLRLTLGDVQGVFGGGEDYVVRFSAGEKRVRAKLDEQGRFVVFLVG